MASASVPRPSGAAKRAPGPAPRRFEATFEDHPLAVYTFRRRVCVVASDVGRLLGYGANGAHLVDVIRKQWAGEMIEGEDFAVLSGADLHAFRAQVRQGEDPSPSRARHLMILHETGLDLVCLKTDKPAGARLRRFLVKDVLPKLRRGEPVLPGAPADVSPMLPGPAPALAPVAPVAPPEPDPLAHAARLLDRAQQDMTFLSRFGVSGERSIALVRGGVEANLAAAWHEINGAAWMQDRAGELAALSARRLRLSQACEAIPVMPPPPTLPPAEKGDAS